MSIRFINLLADEIGPYVDALRALERDIHYPIDDGRDTFTIDHGPEYHPFFSQMGRAGFVLALDGDRVVGSLAGVSKRADVRGRATPSIYMADMKLARAYRGRGIIQRMFLWALGLIPREPDLRSWRYAYIAAMRGERGDVTRSVRGLHLGKLARPAARLAVYFVDPQKLAALAIDGAPEPPREEDGIDLSPAPIGAPLAVSTAGRKDLRLKSTGAPWPLVHLPLGPSRWGKSWGAYLRAAGATLAPSQIACFAIDTRLDGHVGWLARQGIERGAIATVYAVSLTRRTRGATWVHLATSEI